MSRLSDMWLMDLRELPMESSGEPREEAVTRRLSSKQSVIREPIDPSTLERENSMILRSRLIAVTRPRIVVLG